jgi:hypothetical protein
MANPATVDRMIVSAHQPNHLPYMGFFDKMIQSDLFIIQDNFQFERHDFQNRNRIKTSSGVQWLTVPVEHATREALINDIKIAKLIGKPWSVRHWNSLKNSYLKTLYWKDYSGFFQGTYQQEWTKLVDLNMHFIGLLMKLFKIETPLVMSSSLKAAGQKTERLLAQCKEVGASVYLSGIGGLNYLDVQRMEGEGIKVVFQDFQHPVYAQPYGDFVPNLSAVDYLFCAGGKTWRKQKSVLQGK